MFRFLSYPETVLSATVACLLLSGLAMKWRQGWRRGPVMVPAGFVVGSLFLFWYFMGVDQIPNGAKAVEVVARGGAVLSGLLLLLSFPVVPLVSLAGLFDTPCPVRVRLGHSALVVAAWVAGPGVLSLEALRRLH